MVKIVHFSDWHGQFSPLPEADVYVCTGDMLTNFPVHREPREWQDGADINMLNRFMSYREIVPAVEKRKQQQWFDDTFIKKGKSLGLRHFFPKNCKHNPVVVVNGNHEFTDLGPMFGGEVFEINKYSSRSVTYNGLKFGGFTGTTRFTGEWHDEQHEWDLNSRIEQMPGDLDVVVSHMPPSGILDMGFGSKSYMRWITKRLYEDESCPKLFCFGHAHSDYRMIEWDDGTVFSNAATGKRILEIEV